MSQADRSDGQQDRNHCGDPDHRIHGANHGDYSSFEGEDWQGPHWFKRAECSKEGGGHTSRMPSPQRSARSGEMFDKPPGEWRFRYVEPGEGVDREKTTGQPWQSSGHRVTTDGPISASKPTGLHTPFKQPRGQGSGNDARIPHEPN